MTSDRFLQFDLAHRLGLTHRELMETITIEEWREWQAYYEEKRATEDSSS